MIFFKAHSCWSYGCFIWAILYMCPTWNGGLSNVESKVLWDENSEGTMIYSSRAVLSSNELLLCIKFSFQFQFSISWQFSPVKQLHIIKETWFNVSIQNRKNNRYILVRPRRPDTIDISIRYANYTIHFVSSFSVDTFSNL